MENPRDAEGSAQTTICRGGCGFYGSPAQEGLCSKCFKDALKKKQDPSMGSPAGLTSAASTSSLGSTASTASSAPISIPSHSSTSLTKTSDTPDTETPSSSSTSLHDSASCPVLGDSAPPPKKKTRCVECKKKVGLTGFECRCGGLYCGVHRYSDMHRCTFDYKALGEEEIRKANPLIAAQKIQKI